MSKEKTLEKYKDREWLKDQYITQKKTIKQIANEFGYSKTTLTRYKDRFNLKKYNPRTNKNKYANKEWLISQYLNENKSPIQIAEECGVSRGLIFEYISKFNIKKTRELKSEAHKNRIRYTSLKKYGVSHFNSSPEIIQKRKSTNLERYGRESYLGSEEHRNKYGKKVFDGKSLYEWGIERNISNIILYRWLEDNPGATEKQFLSFIGSYIPNTSNIENIFREEFSLDFYNKLFDKNKYQDLRYRPDFKISEKCAINIDGLYWHSDLLKSNEYHFEMRKAYEEHGIRIFQFRGDEIRFKLPIVKSILNHFQGNSNRIFGRKTVIKDLSHGDASKFLEKTHLMGSIKARHIGLYYLGELVMIFSYKVYGSRLKVERVSSKLNTLVIGGFSKLLKACIKMVNPAQIDYWVDLRYGTGTHLKNYGFVLNRETLGWKWTDFKRTYNRLRCRANMDKRGLSEKEHAEELGWHKIYDAGQRLYVWRK